MNTRTTLFLLLLVGLVGAFVVWDHYKGTTTEAREAKGKRILDFETKDVTGIDLVRSNETIGLSKAGDQWNIKQPLAVRADAGAVQSILDELEFAERLRTISESEAKGVSDVDYGFDAPRYRVTLHSKKRPLGLLVGRETPTKEALYVRVEGRKEVCVARKSIAERLEISLDALRNRSAIEFTPAATTRLEIKIADRTIELSRAPGARWSLTQPLVARADQAKVSELLADLESLRIQDFVSEDPKDVHTYQLDERDREVTVFMGDVGKTLVFGKPLTNDAAQVHAKLKSLNSIFTVSADVAKKFTVQINDLRDARLLAFDESAVHGIEIARGAEKIDLNLTGNGWQLTGPVTMPADDPSAAGFLRELAGLRATQFVADLATDLDKYGLATPALTVSLLGDGTNVLEQLLIGGVTEDTHLRYAKNAGEPFIYAIAGDAADRIPGHYATFRARRVFNLKPEQITRLTAGNVVLTRDPQNKWQLVEPPQGVLDADSVQHLLDVLCQLRAESFGGATNEADNNLGFTIKASAGDIEHWLSLTKDGRAAADVCELTFQLQPAVVQTLTKELVTAPPAAVPASP